jgi:hypothetical protein
MVKFIKTPDTLSFEKCFKDDIRKRKLPFGVNELDSDRKALDPMKNTHIT